MVSVVWPVQVSADRKKRAAILESEGQREAAINVANGERTSVILASEVRTLLHQVPVRARGCVILGLVGVQARQLQNRNEARGEAEAILARAEATAEAISVVAKAIQQPVGVWGRQRFVVWWF
jgi:regulator of protease activity HflC (stomatin/prohibitin superfamily)